MPSFARQRARRGRGRHDRLGRHEVVGAGAELAPPLGRSERVRTSDAMPLWNLTPSITSVSAESSTSGPRALVHASASATESHTHAGMRASSPSCAGVASASAYGRSWTLPWNLAEDVT